MFWKEMANEKKRSKGRQNGVGAKQRVTKM